MPSRSIEQQVNSGVASLYNVTVEVQPAGLPAYEAQGLFTSEYAQSEFGEDVSPTAGYAPVLQGQQELLDPDGQVTERAQVWIDGELYRVARQEPDGTGWVLWRLERDEQL